MEDAHVTIDQYAGHPRQGYFAVYDGHGGRGVVEFIETQLHLNLEAELKLEAVGEARGVLLVRAVKLGARPRQPGTRLGARRGARLHKRRVKRDLCVRRGHGII